MSNDTFDAEERRRKAEEAAKKPMSAAPMKFDEQGNVDWGNMWDSFCALALTGGPSHREAVLMPEESCNPDSEDYQRASREIIRGVFLVSGLKAMPDKTGWIAVEADSEGMAEWIAKAAEAEHVLFRSEGARFFVPCGESYQTKGEVKSVITVVAKTTHYWQDHVANEMKAAFVLEDTIDKVGSTIKRMFGRK